MYNDCFYDKDSLFYSILTNLRKVTLGLYVMSLISSSGQIFLQNKW